MTKLPKTKKELQDEKRRKRLKTNLFFINVARMQEGNKKEIEQEKEPEKSRETKKIEEKVNAGLARVAELRKSMADRKQRAELNWTKASDGWASRMAGTGDEGSRGLSR